MENINVLLKELAALQTINNPRSRAGSLVGNTNLV